MARKKPSLGQVLEQLAVLRAEVAASPHRLSYSVRDAAEATGIGRAELYRRIGSGAIRVVRIGEEGGKLVIPRAELERMLDREAATLRDHALRAELAEVIAG